MTHPPNANLDTAVWFLFMDERYPDRHLPRDAQSTTLTGVLFDALGHRNMRDGFYDLIEQALGDQEGHISAMPLIHASELFPAKGDEIKYQFLEGVVELVRALDLKIIRIGYSKSSIEDTEEEDVMGLLFTSFLGCLKPLLDRGMIWPVMETDQSKSQDRAFAGLMQNLDYLTSRFGIENTSVDNTNLGEVLYTTKRSAYGSIVDCIAYLLHTRELKARGISLSKFKTRLAEIADGLSQNLFFEEIIHLQLGWPPPDYVFNGPIRYKVAIRAGTSS